MASEWTYGYDPETRFVGKSHPKGGKKSVCELVAVDDYDDVGHRIADMLNGQCCKSAEIVAAMEELRSTRGSRVVVYDNCPGHPSAMIEVYSDWTEWELRRFDGDSLLAVLQAAVSEKRRRENAKA